MEKPVWNAWETVGWYSPDLIEIEDSDGSEADYLMGFYGHFAALTDLVGLDFGLDEDIPEGATLNSISVKIRVRIPSMPVSQAYGLDLSCYAALSTETTDPNPTTSRSWFYTLSGYGTGWMELTATLVASTTLTRAHVVEPDFAARVGSYPGTGTRHGGIFTPETGGGGGGGGGGLGVEDIEPVPSEETPTAPADYDHWLPAPGAVTLEIDYIMVQADFTALPTPISAAVSIDLGLDAIGDGDYEDATDNLSAAAAVSLAIEYSASESLHNGTQQLSASTSVSLELAYAGDGDLEDATAQLSAATEISLAIDVQGDEDVEGVAGSLTKVIIIS